MGETGIVRFPGNLDPRAQEYRPRNVINNQAQITLFRPPLVYYHYASSLPPYYSNDGGGGYTQYSTHPEYVNAAACTPLPPHSTTPTRTLVLSPVPNDVSESIVRRDLEIFGEVRGVQMERVVEGIVTVHFYDLRHAEMALKEIREQHMQHQNMLKNPYCALILQNNSARCDQGESLMCSYASLTPAARGLVAGSAVWAQYIVPACNAVPDGSNQGTIVVFNLDYGVSSSTLKEIFQAFGPVKELRETPMKKQQRFIEFYDVRDASKALKEMNGKEIYGKPVFIKFSRSGGHNKKFNTNAVISPTTCTNNSTIINSALHTRNSDYQPPQPLPSNFSTRSPSYIPRSFFSQAHHFKKKSPTSFVNGNLDNVCSNKSSSIETSMVSLSLAGTVGANAIEDINPRRNAKKSQNSSKHQQVKTRNRPWKGRQMKKFDARFLISEDAMVESNFKDSRTTVMIKNIPNKYSQKLLLNMLDNHCIHCNEQIAERDDQPLSSYDFVYLPIDFNNKCNVGYGFVNMTSPEATWRLYKAFHLQNWEVFNSRKICEVNYARVQGLEALKEHFKNSRFPGEVDHYLPVVFSPPRDGRELPEPLPIVGHSKQAIDIIGHSLSYPNVNPTDDDHDDNEFDGSDTVDNSNANANDCSSTNGGDLVDDDRDSSSSVLVA